jgi:dTDP-4-amino-4,6-dideoxygalactose transaminase
LNKRNIGVSVHFIPLHLQPYYRDRFGYSKGSFPVAEHFYARCISLPICAAMTDRDTNDVIEAVDDIVTRFRR